MGQWLVVRIWAKPYDSTYLQVSTLPARSGTFRQKPDLPEAPVGPLVHERLAGPRSSSTQLDPITNRYMAFDVPLAFIGIWVEYLYQLHGPPKRDLLHVSYQYRSAHWIAIPFLRVAPVQTAKKHSGGAVVVFAVG